MPTEVLHQVIHVEWQGWTIKLMWKKEGRVRFVDRKLCILASVIAKNISKKAAPSDVATIRAVGNSLS